MQEVQPDLLTFSNEIQIEDEARTQYADIIRWGRFVGLATLILSILFMVIMFIVIMDNPSARLSFGPLMSNTIWLWVVMIALAIVESWLLIKFSVKSQIAINDNDIELFNKALSYLKTFFVLSGILGILTTLVMVFSQFAI